MNLLKTLRSLIARKSSSSFEEIEEFLLSNNFGVDFASSFIDKAKKCDIDESSVRDFFVSELRNVFESVDPSIKFSKEPPSVFLFLGSNGSGKTTTVAKFGNLLRKEGKSVLLIAGDTFRAQATEQLEEWANKLKLPIVKASRGSDPASVVYDGIASAKNKNIDVVLVDTSGRVETKDNLIKEIVKVNRVIEKATGRPPDEVLLVLDSYTGLNALSQVEIFSNSLKITGFVLTKFDGSAPAGVLVPIVDKFKIPVKLLGMGESLTDLEYFSIEKYLSKL